MFTCRACLRRGLTAVRRDAELESIHFSRDTGVTSQPRIAAPAPAQRTQWRRQHGLAMAVTHENDATRYNGESHRLSRPTRTREDASVVRRERWRAGTSSNIAQPKFKTQRPSDPALRRKQAESPTDQQGQDQTTKVPALTAADKGRLNHTLKFLVDPLRFSEHIDELLTKKRDEAGALELLRYASKTRKCTVAWNHVVRWLLAENRPTAAMKIYNEMKKRAQWPDSYTYMHLLKIGEHPRYSPRVLHQALSIYHSMSADNARVEPRTIHTNLALKICNRIGDMDLFWSVASKMPDKGPQSADAFTYSIILNALRFHALAGFDYVVPPEGDRPIPEAARVQVEEAVSRGCRVWADVIAKWRRGDLKMDDSLVCAMGRLLLISRDRRAWKAVLTLVERTENLAWETQVRRSDEVPPSATLSGESSERELSVMTSEDAHHEPSHVEQFAALLETSPEVAAGNINLTFAQPTNNTLSLILAACEYIRDKDAADSYWNLLTDARNASAPGIVPDVENLHAYLRVMRRCPGSGPHALRLVRNEMMPRGLAEPKTFRIAMGSCIRPSPGKGSQRVRKGLASAEAGEGAEPERSGSALADCTALVDAMLVALPGRAHVPTLIAYMRFARQGRDVEAGARALRHFDAITSAPYAPEAGVAGYLLPSHAAGRNARAELARLHGDGRELVDLCAAVRDCVDWVERSRWFARMKGTRRLRDEGFAFGGLRTRCAATARYFGGDAEGRAHDKAADRVVEGDTAAARKKASRSAEIRKARKPSLTKAQGFEIRKM